MLTGDVIMENRFSDRRRLLSLQPEDWAMFLSGIALGAVFILLA
jgi:hypothetical protein